MNKREFCTGGKNRAGIYASGISPDIWVRMATGELDLGANFISEAV
jgi:hypothetical protein